MSQYWGTARISTKNNVTIATASTAAVSSAFGAQTYRIRIASQFDCYYNVGDSVSSADATDTLLPAGQIEYVTVTPGQKIAIYAGTTGTVSVRETT